MRTALICVIVLVLVLAPASTVAAAPPARSMPVNPREVEILKELGILNGSFLLDEESPARSVVDIALLNRTIDEKTAALIMELKHLKEINAFNVKLPAAAYRALKNHPSLERFTIIQTPDLGFVEAIPDGPALKSLRLPTLRIGDSGLKSISKLKSLEILSVDATGTSREGLQELKQLVRLERLDINSFGTQALPDHFLSSFPSLKLLKVELPVDPESLFHQVAKTSLTEFRLSSLTNNQRLAGLEKLGDCKTLERLLLDCPVRDADLILLGSLPKLEMLSIRSDGITAKGIKGLPASRIRELQIVGKKLDPSIIVALGDFKNIEDLAIVNLDGAISREDIKVIASLPRLQSLKLAGYRDNMGEDVLEELGKIQSLTSLKIELTRLTSPGVKKLVGLKNLKILGVSRMQKIDEGLAVLKSSLPDLYIDDFIESLDVGWIRE